MIIRDFDLDLAYSANGYIDFCVNSGLPRTSIDFYIKCRQDEMIDDIHEELIYASISA